MSDPTMEPKSQDEDCVHECRALGHDGCVLDGEPPSCPNCGIVGGHTATC